MKRRTPMCTSSQLDYDSFRILLFRNDASDILLEIADDAVRVPAVQIPRHARVAEEITSAINVSWNLKMYCLFPLRPGNSTGKSIRYHVGEIFDPEDNVPAGMQWISVTSLPTDEFEDLGDLTAIQSSLTTLERFCLGEFSGPFGRPGWLRTVTEWVAEQAATIGLCLTGQFRQLNASPTFSLIRFETDGTALWFKAVDNPNVHEHRVTLRLTTAFPEFLPRILASHPEWNAWLSLESEGSPLGSATEAAWQLAAENLALLQISSFGRGFELIQAGCKDLRPCMLRDLVQPFFDSITLLMERQTKISPTPISRHELLALGREIRSAFEEFEAEDIPNTLGHLDLNPGNVLLSDSHCVFLDWAEGYVGPPFFSFQYLLEHSRRFHKKDLRNESSLVAYYAKHWGLFASPEQIATGFKLTPLLAAFTYAAGGSGWQDTESIPPETAGYFRSLVRRMKCEADALQQGRLACVR